MQTDSYNVIIDPRIAYNYATYYIEGFHQIGIPLSFAIDDFKDIQYQSFPNQGMPLILKEGNRSFNIFIDFHDSCIIDKAWYQWCHIYAKVNVSFQDKDRYEKLMVLGPSFGIDIQNNIISDTILGLRNYLKGAKYSKISLRGHLKYYIYPHIRRRSLSQIYPPRLQVSDNYIFHASTLWYDENTHETTNQFRGEFLKCCKDIGIDIGGGLFYLDSPNVQKQFPLYFTYLETYKDFLYKQRINMTTYIQETQRSFVVFNTPSVLGCHGWKLPEYLCMGKAIISTPLTRAMPGQGLQDGEHIHYIQSIDDIPDAIRAIKNDKAYRKHLEENARAYYVKYLSPQRVIQRIINKVEALTLSLNGDLAKRYQ